MSGRPFLLWSLRFSWGWKKCFLCTKHKRDVLWNRPCAVLLGEEREEVGGCNCHIKGKEFKINVISQSLSPPKRFTVSMLRLVMRHKESTERVKWRREERGRGSDRGNRLAPEGELVWEGSPRRGNFVCINCVASRLCHICVCVKYHWWPLLSKPLHLLVAAGTFPSVPHSVAE